MINDTPRAAERRDSRPQGARIPLGALAARDLDAGYHGSAEFIDLERYEIFIATTELRNRPGVLRVELELWDKRRADGDKVVPPAAYDVLLYGPGDQPVHLDEVARLEGRVCTLGCCPPPHWELYLGRATLAALSCTVHISEASRRGERGTDPTRRAHERRRRDRGQIPCASRRV